MSRQAATLLKFARSISDPEVSAALIEKAAELNSQIDQHPTVQDKAASAPDVGSEPRGDLDRAEQGTGPRAIELIVDGYVRLNDRQALEGLKMHRELLAANLKGKSGWFDYGAFVAQIEDEITVVEAGLARLNSET